MDPQPGNNGSDQWRGIDLSGTCAVLGAGTGRLIQVLSEQVHHHGGQMLVVGDRPDIMTALKPLIPESVVQFVQGRYTALPFATESIDLLAINGVLRQVPPSAMIRLFDEIWRVLIPGGQIRISDIIEATEDERERTWMIKNAIVRKLASALSRPTALSVDLRQAAVALKEAGFDDLSASFLPGYALTDAWLDETVRALKSMTTRLADTNLRQEILVQDIGALQAAYARGEQRASQRFVLRALKVGTLALDMRASFTEDDLIVDDDPLTDSDI